MQQDENLLHINKGQQIDSIHRCYCQIRPGRSTPADPVYWTIIQTGC